MAVALSIDDLVVSTDEIKNVFDMAFMLVGSAKFATTDQYYLKAKWAVENKGNFQSSNSF